MGRRLAGMGLALALGGFAGCAPGPGAGGGDKAFLAGVLATIPRHADWRALTVDDDTAANAFSVTLDYAQAPPSGEPERDTEQIARAILAARVAQGHAPSSDQTSIFVSARRSHIHTETRDDLVVDYGFAAYDFNADALVYRPAVRAF